MNFRLIHFRTQLYQKFELPTENALSEPSVPLL